MADRKIYTTGCFAKRHASAKIRCLSCRHFIVVSQTVLNLMFRKHMPIGCAEKRLRCTACHSRGGRIEAIYPPSR